MLETLQSIRRIYYGILVVTGALIAFSLTPRRTPTYQSALDEIKRIEMVPWGEFAGASAGELAAQYPLPNPPPVTLWHRMFSRSANFQSPTTGWYVQAPAEVDPYSVETLDDIHSLMAGRAALSIVVVNDSPQALADVRDTIINACAVADSLKKAAGQGVNPTSSPIRSPGLDPSNLGRLHPFNATVPGIEADRTSRAEQCLVSASGYEYRNGVYMWKLYIQGGRPLDVRLPMTRVRIPISELVHRRIRWLPQAGPIETALQLRAARYIWDDIHLRTPESAEFFLETRLSGAWQQVSFLGLTIEERTAVSVGPMILALALVYLFGHLLHLRQLYSRGIGIGTLRTFPWAPLFPGRTGRFWSRLSLIAAPLVCGVAVGWRAYLIGADMAFEIVLISTCIGVVAGIGSEVALAKIREQP